MTNIEDNEIDCDNTEEITCPYCWYEYGDSWEASDSWHEECPECEKMFFFSRKVEVTYSSTAIPQYDELIEKIESIIWKKEVTLEDVLKAMESCSIRAITIESHWRKWKLLNEQSYEILDHIYYYLPNK